MALASVASPPRAEHTAPGFMSPQLVGKSDDNGNPPNFASTVLAAG
jgi:hypothetical protein